MKKKMSLIEVRRFLAGSPCNIEVDGLRVLLVVYFITFGFYGYGSDFDFSEPSSLLPATSGLALGTILFRRVRLCHSEWIFRLRVRASHLLAFCISLLFLLAVSWPFVGNELSGDELAYINLAFWHSAGLSYRLDFLGENAAVASSFRAISAVILFSLALVGWIIWRLPIRASIGFTVLTVFGLQIGIFFLPSAVNWGYPRLSWLPYTISGTFLGIEPWVVRGTSLIIVAVGLTVTFFLLKRVLGNPLEAGLALGAAAGIPAAILHFTALDHVVYFAAFGLPAVVFLLSENSSRKLSILALILSIGTIFRLSVFFLLLALLISSGTPREVFSRWQSSKFFHPSFLLLIPYGTGLIVNAPVVGSLDERAEFVPRLLGGVEPAAIAAALLEQMPWAPALLLLVALVIGLLFRKKRTAIVTYILFLVAFYAFFLAVSGLAGEPKYVLEWLSPIALIAYASFFSSMNTARAKIKVPSVKIWTALFVTASVYMTFYGGYLAKLRSDSSLESFSAISTYRPAGYAEAHLFMITHEITACVPIGLVYGSANEVMANRSFATYKFAREHFWLLYEANQALGGDWTEMSAEALDESQVNCVYGEEKSFSGLEGGEWSSWQIAFSGGPAPVTVLLR